MEVGSDQSLFRVREGIPLAIGGCILVAALMTGCTQAEQEETPVEKGRVKGAVGTSIDTDVPIEEKNRAIRPSPGSTTMDASEK